MALTERVEYEIGGITVDKQIRVKTLTIVERDGVELSRSITNSKIVKPGDDVSSQPELVKAVAEVLHTPEVIAAFEAAVEV